MYNCYCLYPVGKINAAFGSKDAWDPRCRGWYQNALLDKTKVHISSPYLGQMTERIYITFSRYVPIGPSLKDSVQAIDIIMNSKIYKQILSDQILHHYFIVTKDS